jgi:hypothetical protein
MAVTAELNHSQLRVLLGLGGVKKAKLPPPWTAKRPTYTDPTTTPKVLAKAKPKRRPVRRKATQAELIALLDATHKR